MIQFDSLLTGATSRAPRELVELLTTFKHLQAQIRSLTATDLYILLRAELRGLKRQTVIVRLQRRLRVVLLDQLDEHFQFLESEKQTTTGDEENE